MITEWVLRQFHGGKRRHSNNGVIKENKMAYEHIFYESGWHPYIYVATLLIPCVTPLTANMMTPSNGNIFGQWRGALMFSLICFWIIGWVNNREAADLRRYCSHYDVTVFRKPAHHVAVAGFRRLIDTILQLGFHTSWANCSSSPEDSTPQFWHSHPCLIQTPFWSQRGPIGFMSGQSMTSTSCCARKAVVLLATLGMTLSCTYTKFRPNQTRPSPREAYDRGEAWCRVDGAGSHPAPPVHSSPMVYGTPYHDWKATNTVHGLDVCIS